MDHDPVRGQGRQSPPQGLPNRLGWSNWNTLFWLLLLGAMFL
ncbi:MAG: hypothetical protein ACP5JJ_10380 [Anaerolineae bacterium]